MKMGRLHNLLIPKKKHRKIGYSWAVWSTKYKKWCYSALFHEYATKQQCKNAIMYYVKEGSIYNG